MIVCCIYRPPPPTTNASWFDAFYEYLSQLTILYSSVCILGDFNVNLLKSTKFCDKLHNSFDLLQTLRSPTKITEKAATLLDHIYISKGLCTVQTGFTNLHIADHLATFCCIATT